MVREFVDGARWTKVKELCNGNINIRLVHLCQSYRLLKCFPTMRILAYFSNSISRHSIAHCQQSRVDTLLIKFNDSKHSAFAANNSPYPTRRTFPIMRLTLFLDRKLKPQIVTITIKQIEIANKTAWDDSVRCFHFLELVFRPICLRDGCRWADMEQHAYGCTKFFDFLLECVIDIIIKPILDFWFWHRSRRGNLHRNKHVRRCQLSLMFISLNFIHNKLISCCTRASSRTNWGAFFGMIDSCSWSSRQNRNDTEMEFWLIKNLSLHTQSTRDDAAESAPSKRSFASKW